MYNPYNKEFLYIAGPECFYDRGYSLWYSQRQLAEYYGFNVVLPTSTVYKLDNEDLKLNAHEIFDDLIVQVDRTTTIISDLETFRGCEPDGGTIFEIGWVYANGGRCYGYTRDKRNMVFKNQNAKLLDNNIVDEYNKAHPYYQIPFAPSVCASTKIIEGSYEDCLKAFMSDLDEERKYNISKELIGFEEIKINNPDNKTILYISSKNRYAKEDIDYLKNLKDSYEKLGYFVLLPTDFNVITENDDPMHDEILNFNNRLQLINKADIVVADLSPFHGLEPNNDVSFECGYAYGKGKKLIGLIDNTEIMQNKIPSINKCGFDICGNTIENFNYPINLMFACTMPFIEVEENCSAKKVDALIKEL